MESTATSTPLGETPKRQKVKHHSISDTTYWDLPNAVKQGPLSPLLMDQRAEGFTERLVKGTNIGFLPIDSMRTRPKANKPLVKHKASQSKHLTSFSTRYADYEELSQLWQEYIRDLLGSFSATSPNKILKADFHGASIRIARAKCPSLVGKEGIVIQETQNVFRIVTPKKGRVAKEGTVAKEAEEGTVVTIPKAGTAVAVKLPEPFPPAIIYASHLRVRSAARSSRKFKTHSSLQL